MQKRTTVFVCEAEPASVAGIQAFLSEATDFAFAGSAPSAAASVPLIEDIQPDLVLIDHPAGARATMPLLSQLRFVSSGSNAVLWTRDVPEAELIRVFQAGARGFVRKTSDLPVLLDAFRQVMKGEVFLEESASHTFRQWTSRRNLPRLTPREREIIELVSQGLKNREIAAKLSITPGTVKVHLMHVFEKTGARDRYELAVHGTRLLSETEPEEIRKTA